MNNILRSKAVIASFVAIVTLIVFLPSLRNDFVNWDDDLYVYENSFIRSLDSQLLKSAFFEFHASNWHPLPWLSHALDYAMWGLNPVGHHLTNNILHAMNAFLVVVLVAGLLEAGQPTSPPLKKGGTPATVHFSPFTLIAAAITGLLFGLHPLHVESVAWVAERKDLLCAFFFLLSIMTYVNYAGNTLQRADGMGHSIKRVFTFAPSSLLSALCCFTLALLSKPMAVTLPFVLLILDWYLFGRIQSLKTFRTAFTEKLPFLALTLISSILTLLAQKTGGAIKSVEAMPLATRLLVAAKSLIVYLSKMILPLHLSPFYPYPKNVSLLSVEYIVPVVIVFGITVMCFAVLRKQKLWMSVWLYYVITLLPVLGIIQVGDQSMADRYTYLPSLGPFLLIGLTAARGYEVVTALNRGREVAAMAWICIALATLLSLSYATREQIGKWKDGSVFWNYVIARNPSVPVAHNNLGMIYSSKGLIDMAIERYQTALSLKPDYAEAYYNLGNEYSSKGLFDMAIKQYRAALSLRPDFAEAHFNLGLTYLEIGSNDMARTEFELGLTIKPDDYRARQVLNLIISK